MIPTLPTSEAIRLLGVSVPTFYRLMRKYNIVSESRGGRDTESQWDAAKIKAIAGARRDIQTLEQILVEKMKG